MYIIHIYIYVRKTFELNWVLLKGAGGHKIPPTSPWVWVLGPISDQFRTNLGWWAPGGSGALLVFCASTAGGLPVQMTH